MPSTPGAASRFSAKNASRSRSTLTWCRSAVNFSFLLCLAAFRARSSACDTRSRPCVRCVLCALAFLLVPALGSAGSVASVFVTDALFVGFPATVAECDFSRCSSSATAPRLPDADQGRTRNCWPTARSPGSRAKSFRTCQGLRPRRVVQALALARPPVLPSTDRRVSAPEMRSFSRFNRLAYAFPCQRFAETLTGSCA
jgi:hypothetical protein